MIFSLNKLSTKLVTNMFRALDVPRSKRTECHNDLVHARARFETEPNIGSCSGQAVIDPRLKVRDNDLGVKLSNFTTIGTCVV